VNFLSLFFQRSLAETKKLEGLNNESRNEGKGVEEKEKKGKRRRKKWRKI